MGIEFDGKWVMHTSYYDKVMAAGYTATEWQGKYVLYGMKDGVYKEIHEFDTPEELNRMLKLLVED